MVVVVGAALAFAAEQLKPFQQDNMKQEKMKNILMAVDLMSKDDDMKDAPELFGQVVLERYLINFNGEIIETRTSDQGIDPADKLDPFNIDVKKEYKTYVQPILNSHKGDIPRIMEELEKVSTKGEVVQDEVHYPLFKCLKDGEEVFVVPMVGTGLWGPIWGFVGIKKGGEVYAAVFDHKTETPGLGAEINTKWFQEPFNGEMIFDDAGNYTPIKVVKGGSRPDDKHGVDAITGGTITSNGLAEMVQRTLQIYAPFFKQ